jgi:hypothetical protein
MFLMYVDESGDAGVINSPTRYFVLTGLVVHELRWRAVLDRLIQFRQDMKARHGLKLREEIHAAHFINNPGNLVRIKRHDRLSIIRDYADALASIPDLNILNVVVDKQGKGLSYGVFENAWRTLIQRLENTISYRNFRGPANTDDRAIILPDNTDNKRLQALLRKLRAYNPIPNQGGGGYRNLPMVQIIEDPVFKDSEHSYFVQSADLAAFLLYQELAPNGYMRKKSGQHYFNRLQAILCTQAARNDPRGIVRL